MLPELISGAELSDADYARKEQAVLDHITRENEPILSILAPLGVYLTTEIDAQRSRAVALLAKVRRAAVCPPLAAGPLPHLSLSFSLRKLQ